MPVGLDEGEGHVALHDLQYVLLKDGDKSMFSFNQLLFSIRDRTSSLQRLRYNVTNATSSPLHSSNRIRQRLRELSWNYLLFDFFYQI
jgi:hypothetical protein